MATLLDQALLDKDRPPNVYAGVGLDRAAERRSDAAWFQARLADRAARFLPVWHARNLVADPQRPGVAWIDCAEAEALIAEGATPILLGLEGEACCWIALDVAHLGAPDHAPPLAGRGHFVDLRSIGPLLPPREAALLAYARGLVHWHGRHRFCGLCGSATQSVQSGHVRRCTNQTCGASHFPRTDPAVIMLVHDGGERCVLGRQAVWPPGMHSTLAGFLEPGESLEEAVMREVLEEVGLATRAVTYHSSQPWPFPSSLMVGFHARADYTPLALRDGELEAARWMTRAELLASPEDESFRLPRRDSIARRLIEDWLADRS